MMADIRNNIVLFDGVCNLCTSSVQFIIQHDPDGYFNFASLQSDYAQNSKISNPSGNESIVLLQDGKQYYESSAALRIAKKLKGAWKLLYAFIIVPKPLRDIVYRFIARNRYKWFGKKNECWLPTPDLKQRFIN